MVRCEASGRKAARVSLPDMQERLDSGRNAVRLAGLAKGQQMWLEGADQQKPEGRRKYDQQALDKQDRSRHNAKHDRAGAHR